MPRPRLKYVHKTKTRHGETAYYFRKGKGGRVRLPDEYGTPEFMMAYSVAAAGGIPDVNRIGTYDRRAIRTDMALRRIIVPIYVLDTTQSRDSDSHHGR